MRARLRRWTLLGCAFVAGFAAGTGAPQHALADSQSEQQRLDELKAMKRDMLRMMRQYEGRIAKLEAEMKEERAIAKREAAPAVSEGLSNMLKGWGSYDAGDGFVLVRGRLGEIDARLIAYARYLNQTQLDRTYTDSFGRKKTLDLRQDIQWNKVNLSFKGWLFDPKFTYRVWIWTQQPAMGEGAQVVVGGQLGYSFNEYFNVFAGIAPLPTTRTTNWTYPFWLKMDNRTVADEFFRGSYSQGFWADGKIF